MWYNLQKNISKYTKLSKLLIDNQRYAPKLKKQQKLALKCMNRKWKIKYQQLHVYLYKCLVLLTLNQNADRP